MIRTKHPLLLSCLSLCLLAGCKSKDAAPEASKDAKPGASEPSAVDKPGDKPGAATAGAPKGKDAPGNLEPIVKAVMGVSDCKFDERNEYLDNDCTALDAVATALDSQGEAKLSAPTLINLLGEQNDAVRLAAADALQRGGWQDDSALVGTVFFALANEKHSVVGETLARSLREVEDELFETPAVIAGLEAAVAAQTKPEIFSSIIDPLYGCRSAACQAFSIHAAKQNPTLENRDLAAQRILSDGDLEGESCSAVADVAIALSQAKPADPDAEFQPHMAASATINDIRTVSVGSDDKQRDCRSELPRLLDEGLSQANAGTLNSEVFFALLDIDGAEDKAKYMAKLETLAKAVEGNTKFDEDMRQTATEALENWKAG